MYGDRRTAAYREGVHSFRDAAKANKHGGGFMFCSCVECRNEKDHTSSRVIQSHLLWSDFMSGYNVWTKHYILRNYTLSYFFKFLKCLNSNFQIFKIRAP
jgi:hypothetical protein